MNNRSLLSTELRELLEKLQAGDRRALAKSITLVESKRPQDREPADALTNAALAKPGQSVRIGLSGPPGVGKSTFIEALGTWLTERGKQVAILAVDPSSKRSGGSILGDKTRMPKLSQSPRAFIRPSPSGTTLGGVARRTREAIILVEAAGFEVVIVETVGVGQSETAVSEMVDIFTLLIPPSGGDELQGVKRGIMELVDIALVTKADGELRQAAVRTAADYSAALHLMKSKVPGWSSEVGLVSSPSGEGIEAYWDRVLQLHSHLHATGLWQKNRMTQQVQWFRDEVSEGLLSRLRESSEIRSALDLLEKKVADGQRTPASAAAEILSRVFPKP